MGKRINRETGKLEEICLPDIGQPKRQREYSSPLNQARLRQCAPPPAKDREQQLRAMSYTEYLKTSEWKAKRLKALRFADFRCQVCNSPDRLEVHHRTYERLGHELLGDLTTLCNDCHRIFHNNRELS